MTMVRRALVALAGAAAVALAAGPVFAADPASRLVQRLNDALVASMKAPKSVGVKGRYAKLAPVVAAAFDLPIMTQTVVGPTWDRYSTVERARAIAAFKRVTVASYAANFQNWAGESFAIDGVQTRGEDRIVQTRLLKPGGAPVALLYQVHQAQGGWGIVDVYFGGVSQVAAERAEFAAAAAQGPAAFTAALNAKADKLLK